MQAAPVNVTYSLQNRDAWHHHLRSPPETSSTSDADTESISSGRVSLSQVVPIDWSKCVFCQKIYNKKQKALINVTTFEACDTIRKAAHSNCDEDMLCILQGVQNDVVAAEGKYHKNCYANYVSKKVTPTHSECQSQRDKFSNAFTELSNKIQNDIQAGSAFDMAGLLIKYKDVLESKALMHTVTLHKS